MKLYTESEVRKLMWYAIMQRFSMAALAAYELPEPEIDVWREIEAWEWEENINTGILDTIKRGIRE